MMDQRAGSVVELGPWVLIPTSLFTPREILGKLLCFGFVFFYRSAMSVKWGL